MLIEVMRSCASIVGSDLNWHNNTLRRDSAATLSLFSFLASLDTIGKPVVSNSYEGLG